MCNGLYIVIFNESVQLLIYVISPKCLISFIQIFKSLGSARIIYLFMYYYFFYESNGFIQQEHIKLTKHDKKNIYNVRFLFQIAAL